MRITTFPKCLIVLSVMLVLNFLTIAQEPTPKVAAPGTPGDIGAIRPAPGPGSDRRPNLLRELGLSQEQLQAIRQFNRERQPREQAARKRFDEANRELNKVIYADNVDEEAYKARLVEYQSAQAELAELKFANELAVRKILTSEQLVKFRDLRRRFAEMMDNMRDRRPIPRGAIRPVPNNPARRPPPGN